MTRRDGRRGHVPERTCIITRETLPREELLRFVLDPQGRVVFDPRGELPGRGAWLKPRRDVLLEAVGGKVFPRAFRRAAKVPPDLPERVAERLRELALDTLSLARKAGQAVSGFDRVAEAISAGRVGVLIEARDGASDGRRKLEGRLKGREMEVEIVDSFDSSQLSLAFSRPNVIHAAMTDGSLARKFVRLARMADAVAGRGDGPGDAVRTLEQSRQ